MKERVELHCHTTMSPMDGVGEGVFIVLARWLRCGLI